MLLACKGGTFHVLRCAYITDTRSLGAEGAPAAENYNLNGRRPFPHARLSPCFHLNISFLCAIQIPRPFFSNGALGHAIPRVVVTLRNFLLPPPFPADAFESAGHEESFPMEKLEESSFIR